jgi:hypothetical protein
MKTLQNASVLRAPNWEVVSLGVLVGANAVLEVFAPGELMWYRTLVSPACFAVVLIAGACRLIFQNVSCVWTALFWYRLATAVYFGIGCLSPFILADEYKAYMQAYFPFSDEQAARLNLVYVTGAFLVLVASNVFFSFKKVGTDVPPLERAKNSMLNAGLLFYAIGAPVKYLLVAPAMFNMLPFVLPGAVAIAGNFTIPAIFFLAAYGLERDRSFFWLACVILFLEMLIGLLGATKQGVMMPLLVFLLALMRRRFTLYGLAGSAVAAALCFITVIPVVNNTRAEIAFRYGDGASAVDLDERLQIIGKAMSTESATNYQEVDPISFALTRLSYTNQGTFVLNQYDTGNPGSSLENAYAVFIPRLLWPDKPIITATGTELNILATGNDRSASSATIPGEAYWNFGWFGVVLIMAAKGVLLAVLSGFALNAMSRGQWIFFPAIIYGMVIGHRVDGHIVADLLGAPVILGCLYVVLAFINHYLISPTLERPAQSGKGGAGLRQRSASPWIWK